ncbi:uncharacterized protein KY384_000952 [Bacidia gigantensis]|uniref:uncharacterized protein n=1 Tax=Bacidia gigantensis TaxID=2732470 RepID=UPI001D03AD2F|nr:uncharacterized protein KY384_000952 [Bacidia gigantensis]KAG8534108.1 hypothetical protein KY384_000952 [Bacidia gigantensis]
MAEKSISLEEDRAHYEIPSESQYHDTDVFGREEGHDIHYKTLSWQLVAVLMIAEIVSNGMLSLPSSLAVVGLVPGIILIVFLGTFALFTSWILIQFKLRHPEVHNMGDAGMIVFGPIGREVLSFGTIVFAVFATGGQILAGQISLAALSDNKLCLMLYTGIFTIPTLFCALPRTLDQLSLLSIFSVISIIVAGIVGMVGAGTQFNVSNYDITKSSDFTTAFFSITNPVFAYAGHFMFFILISEMKHPTHAMRAAWVLQTFATGFYVIFAAVLYVYVGPEVKSPAFSSLPIKWQKAAYGIAIPNFLIAGSLYSHTAAKLLFVRFFRNSRHLHSHTFIGWGVWVVLILIMTAAAFVLAVGVPIFNYLIGIAASLFASWYTYGIAGFFWLYDTWVYKGKMPAWKERWPMTSLSVATIIIGAFICVAGLYTTIKEIVAAYDSGEVSEPFSC